MLNWPDNISLVQEANLVRCKPDDLNMLCRIGRETFSDTFASMNTPENLEAYLRDAFSPERIGAELEMTSSAFYVLRIGNDLAGYLKVNLPPTQSDLNQPGTLEIERIYVVKGHQGSGFGRKLLDAAEQIGVQIGCESAWLGVWEKNVRAIGFYRRMGYTEVGRHSFYMGEEPQSDLIMQKGLGRREVE